MSLIPLLYDEPCDYLRRVDTTKEIRHAVRCPVPFIQPWKVLVAESDDGSYVHFNEDKYEAILDVRQFSPNEIAVKVIDGNQITIEAKHDEKQDKDGNISRQFVVPEEYDIGKVEPRLSNDGMLTITAPKKDQKHEKSPVTEIGESSKTMEEKEDDEDEYEKKYEDDSDD